MIKLKAAKAINHGWRLPMGLCKRSERVALVGGLVLVAPHSIYWISIFCYRFTSCHAVVGWFAFCECVVCWIFYDSYWIHKRNREGETRSNGMTLDVRWCSWLVFAYDHPADGERVEDHVKRVQPTPIKITRDDYTRVGPNKHQQVHLRNVKELSRPSHRFSFFPFFLWQIIYDEARLRFQIYFPFSSDML